LQLRSRLVKPSRRPKWNFRSSLALVIAMKLFGFVTTPAAFTAMLLTFAAGLPKRGVLVKLNASALNWSTDRSVNWKSLHIAKSAFWKPGPRSEFRPIGP
jgi:hypothetical protein